MGGGAARHEGGRPCLSLTAAAVWRVPPTAAGCASWPFGAGASLIALLREIAKQGCDCLLISHRHRRDHRSELAPGHVRTYLNRVFLGYPTPAFQQPLELHAIPFAEPA